MKRYRWIYAALAPALISFVLSTLIVKVLKPPPPCLPKLLFAISPPLQPLVSVCADGSLLASAMTEFLRSYPYFSMSLILLTIFLIGLVVFRSRRRIMLICALLSTPFCLLELAFIPEYWTPAQIGGAFVGPGDFIFSFATGGLAWMFAILALRQDVSINWKPWTFGRRFVGSSAFGIGVSLLLWSTGLKYMTSALIGGVLLLIGISWRYRRLARLSLSGGVGFLLLYVSVLKLTYVLFPMFVEQWNHQNLSGILLWQVPLEEALWALAYGVVWPRLVAYALDADVQPASAEDVVVGGEALTHASERAAPTPSQPQVAE